MPSFNAARSAGAGLHRLTALVIGFAAATVLSCMVWQSENGHLRARSEESVPLFFPNTARPATPTPAAHPALQTPQTPITHLAPPVVALASTALAFAIAIFWFLRASGKCTTNARDVSLNGGAAQPLEPEDEEDGTRNTLLDGELRQMLSDAEQADPELSVGRPSKGKPANSLEPDLAQRAEAEHQMERVLASRDTSSLFGHGDAHQQDQAFRRLVGLLHPDNNLVSGPLANLALRRVLEAHRSFRASK